MTANPVQGVIPTEDPRTQSWVERLVRFLDDGWRVPGTSFRFGADAVLGLLFPGFGDALTASASASVFWLALRKGVPHVVLARMVFNVALDAVLGAIPLVGDAFDFAWKANRKNWNLLARYRDTVSRRARFGDYAVMALVVLFLLSAVILPWLFAAALARYLWPLPT